jgi:ubiquinone biosynthesis monooxygenase Coq7
MSQADSCARADRRREMLRVDHAGEYGAVAIYRGQLAVFERQAGHERIVGQLREMAGQEQVHLDAFDKLLADGHVRPTALSPIWNAAGFAIGAATALLGEKAAHACTEAVETVIEEHYGDQVSELEADGDGDLAGRLAQFRDEEVAHKDLASAEGAAQAPGYPLLSALIRTGCRIAIRISEKV